MPELVHACHNCASLGEWYAAGAHCWCRKHCQTVADPVAGCAYWVEAKNARLIPVPPRVTLSSADFGEVQSAEKAYAGEMRRQAQALIDNGWRPDRRKGRARRGGDEGAGYIAPDVWKAMNDLAAAAAGPSS